MKRILIAVDGSPPSNAAVELALELARTQGGHAIIAHVAPELDTMPLAGTGITGALQHRVSDADRRPLVEAAARAEEHGVLTRSELLQGSAAHEIVRLADAVDADVIVMGSRGRGAVAGVLLGSVSQAVLHGTKRSVLIVRSGRPSS
jgi:nucleotide-binding universal stress UspA family protein